MATLSNNDIARAIYMSTKEKAEPAKVVQFLAHRHLLGKSTDILARLQKLIDAEHGTVRAKIKTAKTLTHKEKNEIEDFLVKRYSQKGAVLEESIDPELLGGSRIEINDEVIDLTLKNKILQLQEHLTKSA